MQPWCADLCLLVAPWQWRTWRKKCAPADDTGETPSITHRCWRARWRQWRASWWARWTTSRSWGTSCAARSRRRKSAKPRWRSWQQGSGEPIGPLRLNVIRRERSRVGFMEERKRLELLCWSSSCSPQVSAGTPVFWHPETKKKKTLTNDWKTALSSFYPPFFCPACINLTF